MVSDVAKPSHVTSIAFVVRLLEIAAGYNPFELSALIDQKDIAESFKVGDAICHAMNAVVIGNQLPHHR